MKKIIYILTLFIFCSNAIYSQYFPVFSQYLVNGLVINPAYTGSREVLSINFSFRNQMTGIEGAPVYETFSVHAPLKNPRIAIGLLLFNESNGGSKTTHVFSTYAYKLQVGSGKLNLGLQAGMVYKKFNWGQLYLNKPDDPAFNSNNESYVMPNIGAGAYFYSRSFSAGLSIPYFLSYEESTDRKGYDMKNNIDKYNFLFSSAYLFNIDRNFKLKASTLIKYYISDDEQIDFNLSAILFQERLWVGAAYRMQEATAGMFEVQLNPQFRISYTFEYTGMNAAYYSYTSHEIGLRYEFSYKLKAFNPRYF